MGGDIHITEFSDVSVRNSEILEESFEVLTRKYISHGPGIVEVFDLMRYSSWRLINIPGVTIVKVRRPDRGTLAP